MLSITDLHISLEEENKAIINGLSLHIKANETHAIMGPNGSGKSTLAYTLAGREGYRVTSGQAMLEGNDIIALDPAERALAGLFLAFQYPVEIAGVGNMTFLRTAVNAHRVAQGETELSAADFLKAVRAEAAHLQIAPDILTRSVNAGFSGGEKKRNEILQMAMLAPKLCVLDETDSGLDVDAMQLVAQGVNRMRNNNRSFLIITHYQRLLNYIKPDFVHIMVDGRIVKTGHADLALHVEQTGYADFLTQP